MKELWKIVCFLRVVSCVLSETLVFRNEGIKTYHTWNHQSRKLFCTSDNFDDALVWNTNLDWADLSVPRDVIHTNSYPATYKHANSKIDCDFLENENCLRKWNTSTWSFISTLKEPMGPLFDKRWEDFREYGNRTEDNYWLIDKEEFQNKGTLIFSVRGTTDVHLLLCSGNNYVKESCFVIVIGGWNNTRSAIRNCQTGVPIPPRLTNKCSTLKEKYHNPLSSRDWRTIILSWNFTNSSDISVKNIITSGSIQNYTFKMDIKIKGQKPKNYYYLFYRTMRPILFRFHIYNYFQTNKKDDVLMSPVFKTQKNFCIQMTIGLCNECKMMISLVDIVTNLILKSIEVESTTATFHKLPTWKSLIWNVNIPYKVTKAQLRINTKLEKYSSNPLWAVAIVRECRPIDSFKTAVMTASQDYVNGVYYWPNVTCQRLSYNGTTIVSSISEVSSTININDKLCLEGKIGEHCAINCRNLTDKNDNCAGIVVCKNEGCMCPQGFVGPACNTPCGFGRYGFGCNETCGRCSRNSACNFLSGECHLGCDRTEKYYVKPFCKIGIDVPSPPEIKFLNETYVQVSLPIHEEYRKVEDKFLFVIKENDREIACINISRIDNNLQKLEAGINNLKAGISYKLRGIVVLGASDFILGEWRNFTTSCTSTSIFKIHDIRSTSFIIMSLNESFYSCPHKSYQVFLKTKLGPIFSGKVSYPHQFQNLSPFTTYHVLITRDENAYFSQSIRTSISAPSEVRRLQVISITEREVSLRWMKPEKENGYLQGYEILVQPLEFYGCFNKTLPSSETIRNYTSTNEYINIQNLHPYTKYNFKIAARVGDNNLNTIIGIPIGINFATNYTARPTAIFSNLRLLRNKLIWDPPKNCFTVTGPVQQAKLIFTGFSKSVITYRDIRETTDYYFILGSKKQTIYGAETYFVNLYIGRVHNGNVNINVSNYQRLEFLSPPTAPPPVRNFEIYEGGIRTSLRWQPPNPPTNGDIIFYTLEFCSPSKCKFFERKVLPNETCELWDGYICATVRQTEEIFTQLKIFAHNKNVNEAGEVLQIDNEKAEKAPDAPSNISAILFPEGIVHLFWTHPWKSGGPIEKFLIHIKLNSTILKNVQSSISKKEISQEHVISKYNLTYNTKLFLLSSSEYKISVQALTSGKLFGGFKNITVRTPSSIAFFEEIQTKTHDDNSTISIILPQILNNTLNNLIYVIVKGPVPCENYSVPDENIKKISNIKYYEISWCAASFTSENHTKREFNIGDNKTYGGGKNCVLYPEHSYVIFVVVKTKDEKLIFTQSKSILLGKSERVLYEMWIILVPVLITVLVLILYWFYFRGKKAESKLSSEYEIAENCNNKLKNIQMENSRNISQIEASPKIEKSVKNICPESKKLKIDDEKSNLIEVQYFEDYVKLALNSGELDEQFNNMPKGLIKSTLYGKLSDNKIKNRYANLITYDESRVVLETLPDDPSSDYINASYIKNTTKDRFYIATQGPKPNTVIDFWRMVWQEKVSVICMVANIIENDKAKCEQYWPEVSKRKLYGDVIVANIEETVFNYYTIRLMNVTRSNETRKIMHLHYIAWPDHGIPLHTYSVVSFMQKMLTTCTENSPVIVHCSAGVGRTGTIILLDICLHQAANKGAINIKEEFEEIRKQRYLIESKQQYLFVHLILVEYFFSMSTNFSCDEDLSKNIEEMKKKIKSHEERLKEISWRSEILQPFVSKRPVSAKNLAKNRFPNLAAGIGNKVYLKRCPVSDEDSDYISAVYVDGVKQKNQYLSTQLPLPSTLSDFWRMIAELKVEIVIMLQTPDTEDLTCCELISVEKEFKPVEYLNISVKHEDVTNGCNLKTLELVDYSEKVARQQSIILISCSEWKSGKNEELPKPETLVALWQTVDKLQTEGKAPVVTICYDGVTGCGLYLAMSFLLERMNSEGECDVISAIRAIRKSRSDFIQSIRHFEFLYNAALCSVR